MKITVLCEDTSRCDLECEHGLSLYIESECGNILFDAGQSALFYENAEKCGIDLSRVDFAVISHGHYDHGGGLEKFLQINKKAPVYISENAFGDFYNGEKYIGLKKTLKDNNRLVSVSKNRGVCKGAEIFTSASLEKKRLNSFGLTAEKEGKKLPDKFDHEIYLELIEGRKKVLFSGCSHAGIENIMRAFSPDIFVGGFHLIKTEDENELAQVSETLIEYNTDYYTCHCTGEKQYEYLKKNLNSLKYLRTGDTIVI